jgi:hypothetical protein
MVSGSRPFAFSLTANDSLYGGNVAVSWAYVISGSGATASGGTACAANAADLGLPGAAAEVEVQVVPAPAGYLGCSHPVAGTAGTLGVSWNFNS